jgi:hypothetical protein
MSAAAGTTAELVNSSPLPLDTSLFVLWTTGCMYHKAADFFI